MKKVLLFLLVFVILVLLTPAVCVVYILVPYRNRVIHEIPEENLIEIQAFDGLNLAAEQIIQKEPAQKWALLLHSYRTDHTVMYKYGQFYLSEGYNILYPDNRAHGNSEGRFIGMGYLDRLDVLEWVRYILSIDHDAQIVIHGLSMGAAASLCFSGLDVPELDHIKAVIADCSYQSAESYLTGKLQQRFHLPSFPLIPIANIAAKVTAGYELADAAPIEFIKNSTIPTLIIHGQKDESVSVNDAYALYNAAHMRKDLLIIPNAGHSQAMQKDQKIYWDTVADFIKSSN